ncbi:MAG TPA: hypothetical protein DC051_01920 [Stenotrophomonas maltophilia]|nr:hypothetical protein [Stenotrophomonas maltophilia]
MSNDKTTLADVQPGGRVRLGDQNDALAVSLRQIADAKYTRRQRFNGRLPADVQEVIRMAADALTDKPQYITDAYELGMRDAQALSAQPSPGGQDALAALQQDYDKLLDSFNRQVEVAEKIAGRVLQQDDRIEELEEALAARQPVGEPVAIPEGWALVDLAEYTVLPQIPTTAMMDAGWPIGEQITDRFDVKGAYADLIAEHDAKGEGIIHGPSQQPAQAVDLGTGVKAIAAERERQLQTEGFTRDGDQQYRRGELAKAATAYVQLAAMDLEAGTRNHIAWHGPAAVWPWAPEWWKPVDARRDLVRAGALIAAQIDLIDSQAMGRE